MVRTPPPCSPSGLQLAAQALADAKLQPQDLASVEVVGGSSRVPALIAILSSALGCEPSRTLNAKECISRGAALNCAMLSPIFRFPRSPSPRSTPPFPSPHGC